MKVKLKKVYNNNVLLCLEGRDEIIVTGRGIAFGKKPGDLIEEDKIERKFVLYSDELVSRYSEVLKTMSLSCLETAGEIVDEASRELGVTFHDDIFIAISDHIQCALRRQREGKVLKNALLWEIKQYYRREFDVAMKALAIIQYHEGVTFPEDEAGFIALHFVNGQMERPDMARNIEQVQMTEDIMKFVTLNLGYYPDDSDFHYNRFLVHIKFLLVRLFENKQENDEDLGLTDFVIREYSREYNCAVKIGAYLKKRHGFTLSDNEITYLTIHMRRLVLKE